MDYQSYEDYIRGTMGYPNTRNDDPYSIYSMGAVSPTDFTASAAPVNPVMAEIPMQPAAPTGRSCFRSTCEYCRR